MLYPTHDISCALLWSGANALVVYIFVFVCTGMNVVRPFALPDLSHSWWVLPVYESLGSTIVYSSMPSVFVLPV